MRDLLPTSDLESVTSEVPYSTATSEDIPDSRRCLQPAFRTRGLRRGLRLEPVQGAVRNAPQDRPPVDAIPRPGASRGRSASRTHRIDPSIAHRIDSAAFVRHYRDPGHVRMDRIVVVASLIWPALLSVMVGIQPPAPSTAPQYVGSAACNACHAPIYARWSKTRMANVVRDPKVHPDAIIPDLSRADPLVTFTKNDIAFVYGSKWKQRYFTKAGDDYFPLGAQWDVTHQQWRRYMVADGTDWWVPHYPADNLKRPTGPTCDGCHSVNYDVRTKRVTEWNVGCEKCHGPGSQHVAHPEKTNIFNPSHVDAFHANDTCIQCHSQGQPLTNPIEGRYFDWPVGFHVGLNLSEFL